MKNQQHIHAGQNQAILNEAWITDMIEKLDKSNMSGDERAIFETSLARNGSIIQSWEQETERKIKKATAKSEAKAAKEKERARKAEANAAKAKADAAKAKADAVKAIAKRDFDIAKDLKSKGMSNADIADVTGLSIDEIESF